MKPPGEAVVPEAVGMDEIVCQIFQITPFSKGSYFRKGSIRS